MVKNKALGLTQIALCAALISVGGLIKITVFSVPFTLQTFFLCFTVLILGAVKSAASVAVYIFIGLLGLPVFAKGGGFYYVLEPTFGYVLGFLPAVAAAGIIIKKCKGKFLINFAASIAALSIIYLTGSAYFYFVSKFYLNQNLSFIYILVYCVLVFIPVDTAFAALASIASIKVNKLNFHIK